MKKIFTLIMLAALVTLASCSGNVEEKPDYTINDLFHNGTGPLKIYYVWGDGCPICAQAAPFVDNLENEYNVDLVKIEVYGSQQNQATFSELAQRHGSQPGGVPTFFIGGETITGYDNNIREQIENTIEGCLENPESCEDPLVR